MALEDLTPDFINSLPLNVNASSQPRLLAALRITLDALSRDCDVSVSNAFTLDEVEDEWQNFLQHLRLTHFSDREFDPQEPANVSITQVVGTVDSFNFATIPDLVIEQFRLRMKSFLIAEAARQRALAEVQSGDLSPNMKVALPRLCAIVDAGYIAFDIPDS